MTDQMILEETYEVTGGQIRGCSFLGVECIDCTKGMTAQNVWGYIFDNRLLLWPMQRTSPSYEWCLYSSAFFSHLHHISMYKFCDSGQTVHKASNFCQRAHSRIHSLSAPVEDDPAGAPDVAGDHVSALCSLPEGSGIHDDHNTSPIHSLSGKNEAID